MFHQFTANEYVAEFHAFKLDKLWFIFGLQPSQPT